MADQAKVGGVSVRPANIAGSGLVSKSGRTVGGVSPKPGHERLLAPAAGPASPAHSDFVWNGGPVLTCPLMYATFWGPSWTSSPSGLAEAARLTQFLQDIVNSQYMNVLSQYRRGQWSRHGPVHAGFFYHQCCR